MFKAVKDGGPLSKVWGYLLESKRIGSIGLLRFENGTREAYHDHAFNCVSLILGPGFLVEEFTDGFIRIHRRGKVLVTRRSDYHKVTSFGRTWVFTIRGPWAKTWREIAEDGRERVLSWGRRVVR